MTINVGDKIPKFIAKDHNEEEFDSMDLIGSPFVIYFYPKDDTPGCTIEACSFRDNIEQLDSLDTIVVGVSPDSPNSHSKFREKHELTFTLLCDENMELAQKFGAAETGAAGAKPKIIRSTFVVDSSGTVRWLERPVSIEGHVNRVIKALEALHT
jgi:peroxiredoxin Q/BCP